MSRNSDNTLIYHPVNTADVSYVTRKGSNDVGTLCGASNTMINMWSKYKPVIKANVIDSTVINGVAQLNSDKTWKSTATWWWGDKSASIQTIDTTSGYVLSTSCGITIKGYYGTIRHFVNNWDTNGWRHYWTYNPPTGGMAAPYRLIDFNYYKHNANPPFRDYQAPLEIVRYKYGSEYVVTGQASVKWPAGTTAYQLTMNDLQVKNGASDVVLSDYYFGVLMAYIKTDTGADVSENNRTYGIITAAEKWNETVQPSGSAPQDIRYTQPFTTTVFQSFGTYRLYPILSKAKYNGDTTMDYSATIGGQDYAVYPLPFAPIDCVYRDQEAAIIISVTLTRTGTGYLRINLTAQNTTNEVKQLNFPLINFWFVVYPKDSNHSTLYDQPTYYPSDAQTGGRYYYADDDSRTEINIPANSTVTSTMSNVPYTDKSYGCFIQMTIDYPLGVVRAGGIVGLDYNL